MADLKRILVDFNCGINKADLMRLNTRGSIHTLAETGAQVGERVILYDGDDCWVGAQLVEHDGKMYARFKWDDIANVDREDESDEERLKIKEPKLKTIFADFNVGPGDDGLMRLTTYGSVDSLRETGAVVGEKVILSDDDLWVVALLVKRDGIMYGKFDWDHIADVKGPNPQETETS